MRTGFHPWSVSRHPPDVLRWEENKAKTYVVVPVIRLVPVTIGRPAIPGLVVPTAAP